MTVYRFRLETVLRVRRAEESDAKANLLRANARLRAALAARDRAQGAYRHLVDHQRTTGSVDELRRDRWHAEVAARTLADAQREAMRLAGEAALAQVEWAQAARRVAVLERLDLRRRAEHDENERRAEVGLVDDLVTARYAAEHAAADVAGGRTSAPAARPQPSAGRPPIRLVPAGGEATVP